MTNLQTLLDKRIDEANTAWRRGYNSGITMAAMSVAGPDINRQEIPCRRVCLETGWSQGKQLFPNEFSIDARDYGNGFARACADVYYTTYNEIKRCECDFNIITLFESV